MNACRQAPRLVRIRTRSIPHFRAAVATLAMIFVSSGPLLAVGLDFGGAPRRWGAGMPVGEYSVVDLETGRMLTTIPIVSWDGRGSGISFSLYHSMSSNWDPTGATSPDARGDANADGSVDRDDITPFVDLLLQGDPSREELGIADFDANGVLDTGDLRLFLEQLGGIAPRAVWTTSYSGRLNIRGAAIEVVSDDWRKDKFISNGQGGWDAPPGVFDTLTADQPPGSGYTLTSKAQWKRHYYDHGRLDYVEDPSGNRVTCHYDYDPGGEGLGEFQYVEDEAYRQLYFVSQTDRFWRGS